MTSLSATASVSKATTVMGGGSAQVRTFDQGTARYQLQVRVQINNLTNETNYLGYSGIATSPFSRASWTGSGLAALRCSIASSRAPRRRRM